MADYCTADKLLLCDDEPLASHWCASTSRPAERRFVLEQGINGNMITLYDEQGHNIPLLWTHLIPATLEGRALHNVQNAMFAAALAYHMHVDLEDIRHGAAHFRQHLLPVSGPPQRLRQAPLQGDPGLRPQRRRR
jgi:cyanophycin synthetase